MSKAVKISITLNPNLNSKKPIFFSKKEERKIINYHQEFKLNLFYLSKLNYNLISCRTKTYFTLPR